MKISKRILAVLLCVALLMGVPVALSVSADETETARAALIEAWGKLAKEEGTVLIQANTTIANLPDLGLTAAQKAQMGTHFTMVTGDSGWKKQAIKGAFSGYDRITYSRYAADAGRIETFGVNADWSKVVYFEQYKNISTAGFETVDLTDKLSGVTGLEEVNYYSEVGGPFYIGSVMGWKKVQATLPEGAASLSAKDLYAEAAAVDLSTYSEGVEAFEAARIALQKLLNPAAAALIEAWDNLVQEEATVLARPDTDIAQLADSLTAAQKVQMGTHYATVNWNEKKATILSTDFAAYDKITLSAYSPDGMKFQVSTWNADNTSTALVPYNTSITGFQTYDLTGKITTKPDLINYNGLQGGTVYVGSILGWKRAEVTVPDHVSSLSAAELLLAASEVELSTCVEGAEAFEAAKMALYRELYPKAADLLEAWDNLAKEEGTVLIQANTTIANLPDLGLTAAQKAQMGTHFTMVTGNSGWKKQAIKGAFSGYDRITYSRYAADAGRIETFGVNADWSNVVYFEQYKNISTAGFETVDLTAKLSGVTGLEEVNYYSEFGGPFYIGSVMGWKQMKETAPANATALTEQELLAAASELDLSSYSEGAEAFEAAKTALHRELYPAAADLLVAWGNLAKEEGTVLVQGTTAISELPNSLGLTDAQKAQMGTHYTKLSGESGWVKQTLKGDFSGYDRISYSRYTEGAGCIENIVCDFAWSNIVYLEQYKVIDAVGFETVDLTEKLSGVTGLQEGQYSSVYGGPFYIGSVMGWKQTKETVPAEAFALNNRELYALAEQLDTSVYTVGAEAFETALAALLEAINSEPEPDVEDEALAALIQAWKKLAAESKPVKKVIATPQGSYTNVDSQSIPRKEVAADTDIGTDVATLGSHYVEKLKISRDNSAPAWNYDIYFSGLNATDLSDFNAVYFYMEGYDANGNVSAIDVSTQVNGGNDTYTAVNGWQKVNVAPVTNASNIKFVVYGGAVTYVSFGSVIAEYDYIPAMPAGYASMSLAKLVEAAKAIDCEGFENTALFKAALENAEKLVDDSGELKDKLLKAWQAIGNAITDELATPQSSHTGSDGVAKERTVVIPSTVVEGLADTSVLGNYYMDKLPMTEFGFGTKAELYLSLNPLNADFSKYDSITMAYAVYNANGEALDASAMLQVNGGPDAYASGTGWSSFKTTFDTAVSNIKFLVFKVEGEPAYFSFGSVLGHYVQRPDYPENAESLSFVDLVEAAEACDMTGYDATEFNAALRECQEFIAARKQAVLDESAALGLELPENAAEMTVQALVEAAQTLEIPPVIEDTNDLGLAVWMLNMLTDDGQALENLRAVWKRIAALPKGCRLLTPAEWVAAGDALDISAATTVLQTEFVKALELVRDLLSKGKADITRLQELVDGANTMKYYDYEATTWPAFDKARTQADNVLENYKKFTQKQVDEAADSLYDAWGELKMLVRVQWLDFMAYFTKEDPQMGLGKGSGANTAITVVKDSKIPNGVDSFLQVTTQNQGWLPVSASGVACENLSKYQYLEVWFRADEDQPLNILMWQLNKMGGGLTYDLMYSLPSGSKTGEWVQLQIPVSAWESAYTDQDLTENESYQAGIAQFMVMGGTSSYSLANLVAVYTEPVTAGVVPEVPALVKPKREEIKPPPAPENPFTGVDRGDPWGDEEKKDEDSDEESEETPVTPEIEAKEVATGTCGENLEWVLMDNGELTVTGTGAMDDFDSKAPWDAHLDKIIVVKIEEGVTSIGNSAFYACPNLSDVQLSKTVTAIGEYAFYECPSLKFIVLPDAVDTIGDYALGYVYDTETETAVAVKDYGIYGTQGSVAEDYAAAYELAFHAIAPKPDDGEDIVVDPDDGDTENDNTGDSDDDWGSVDEENSTDDGTGNSDTDTDTDNDVTVDPEAQVVESGSCGADLTWTFYDDGSLVISGTGAMDDFESVAPWVAAGHTVTKVIIEEGVTSIGDSAFYGCSQLAELSVPGTVTRVGAFAFYECYGLTELKVTTAVTEIGPYAFGYIYDATAGDAAVLDGFKLLVTDPSAALVYAQTYEVPYEVYETLDAEEQPGDGNTDGDAKPAQPSAGLDWWIWLLIGLGAVVVLGGGTVLILAVVKKNKQNTEVSQ